ncbi:MAG TPA: esterase-like activity of phytase family protein [Fibrobacteria bacterium]|nr:esterase-like activity of phytase family protein [Fibrobacteria bacterium]
MRTIERLPRRLALVFALAASSCSSPPARSPATLVPFDPPPSAQVRIGGVSDLALDPSDSSGYGFVGVSDRGPNDPKGGNVRFPFPRYHQKLSRFRLERDGSIRLVGTDSVKDGRDRWTTGLPSPLFPATEQATTTGPDGRILSIPSDSAGFDFEGLASDGAGTLWASEEYGPRIVRMRRDAPGGWKIDRTLSPGGGLPAVFSRRAANKGLEALCRAPDGALVAIFQGALANTAGGSMDASTVAERSLVRRILLISPDGARVSEHLAQMPDDPGSKAKRRTRIGACTALDDGRILVLEHRKKGKGRIEVDLVAWSLDSATDVHLASDPQARGRLVGGATLEDVAMAPDGLAKAGIRPVDRSLVSVDLTRDLDAELAKPEGLVVFADSTALISFDNDFGVKGAGPRTWFLKTRLSLPRRR